MTIPPAPVQLYILARSVVPNVNPVVLNVVTGTDCDNTVPTATIPVPANDDALVCEVAAPYCNERHDPADVELFVK